MKVMVQAALELIQQIPEPERAVPALIVMKSNWHFEVVQIILNRVERILVYSTISRSTSSIMSTVSWSICVSLSTPGMIMIWNSFFEFCLVPYFEDQQVETLKELARQANVPLIRVLKL